jgi:D-alanyl-D-alanine carboxypeptidase
LNEPWAEGGVGLEDRVADHLSEFGTFAPGVAWAGREWVEDRFRTYPPQELVGLALSKPPRFEPGTDWSYADTNYVLAGLLIERVTGRSLAEETHRLFPGPLGMTGTVVPTTGTEVPEPHAHAYYRYGEDGRETDGGTLFHHNGGIAGSAALMYATADGGRTLTASLTCVDDAGLSLAQTFQETTRRLVEEVFGGGRTGAEDEAAEQNPGAARPTG